MAYDWENFNTAYQILTQAGRERKKKAQEMQDMFQQELMKAQIKSQFDPEAQFRNRMLGLIEGGAQPQQAQMETIMPQTRTGEKWMPESLNFGGLTIKRKPTEVEMEQEEGKKTRIKAKQDLQDANDFISGLAQQYKNTEAAMPKTSLSQPKQRLRGFKTRLGAFTGIGVSPKQTAELSTQKIRARSLIKKFESGRLTDADIADAVSGMTDVGKTTAERLAIIINLATAIGADKGLPESVAKQQLANKLGMNIQEMEQIISTGSKYAQTGTYEGKKVGQLSNGKWEYINE